MGPAAYVRRIGRAAAVVFVVFAGAATEAHANTFGQRFLDTTAACCASTSELRGSRATVHTPALSEISQPAFTHFDSMVAADDNYAPQPNMLQAGVTREYALPAGPSCDKGSTAPTLYFFVEKATNGMYECYFTGYTTTASSAMHSVVRNADGIWRAYLNSNATGISHAWSRCGGNACRVRATGESSSASGSWPAKYAGAGNTLWQRFNGSWTTIQSSYTGRNSAAWTFFGPFPTGIWTIKFN